MIYDMDDGDGQTRSDTRTAEFATSRGLLRIEDTYQTITWEDAADERWSCTDQAGHRHAYQSPAVPAEMTRPRRRRKGRKAVTENTHYPTLLYVVDREHWCHGNEGVFAHDGHWATDEAHYECRQCGEKIAPGHGPGSRQFHVGRSATLTEELADPPLGWADEGYGVSMRFRGGRATGVRTRSLSREETAEIIALAAREEQERRLAEDARRVERALGYPPGFTEGR